MIDFVDFTTLVAQLLVIVFIVETVTEVVKAVFKEKGLTANVTFYISLVVGIASAVVLKITLFDTDNAIVFYVGAILAGAIASRGANHVHDILKTLSALNKK
jgi:ABC-type polysaccharide/polyol phosphate export permease